MFIYIKTQCRNLRRNWVINKVSVVGGYYFEISFRKSASKKKIAKAVKICDRTGKLPIVCGNIPLYPKEDKRRLDVAPFRLFLLINTFCHVIKGCERALITDKTAKLCEYLEKPIKSVRTLYILTSVAEKYEEACEELLCRFGVSPIIIEKINPLFPFAAVFSPFETDKNVGNLKIGKGGFQICEDEVILCGKRIPFLLAAAIHTCIGANLTANALPCFLESGNKKCSPDALRTKIKDSRFSP